MNTLKVNIFKELVGQLAPKWIMRAMKIQIIIFLLNLECDSAEIVNPFRGEAD